MTTRLVAPADLSEEEKEDWEDGFDKGWFDALQKEIGRAGGDAPLCWVARAVYGGDDPRWRLFRAWLLHEAPAWFRGLYIRHGEAFAVWLDDKPAVKAVIRRWMDARLRGVVERRIGAPAVGMSLQ